MSDIDRLRDSLPWAKGMGDAELIGEVSKRAKMSPVEVAQMLGVPTGEKRNALAAGLSSGVDDLQGLGYSALAAGADAVGATGPRNWLNRRADANQVESQLNGRPDLERVEDQTFGSALPYLGYQIAKQVPNLAASIGAGLLVPEVAVPAALSRGLALGPRALGMGGMGSRVAAAAEAGTSQFAARRAALEAGQTFGKQLVGGGAMNYAQGVGSLYQEAADGGDPNAGLSALAGGLPYALTETLPEAMLVGRIGHGSGFKGNLLTRMGKAGATQGAAGASSELLQNEMEMAYNGTVSDDQAFSRRLNSGVAGGLVEGVLGLGGGVRRASPAVRTDGKVDLLGSTPAQPPAATLQLGYDPSVIDGAYQTPDGRVGAGVFMAMPDGSAIDREQFAQLNPLVQHFLVNRATQTQPDVDWGRWLSAAEGASAPAAPSPTGIEQNLGLVLPGSAAEQRQRVSARMGDMQAALNEPTAHVVPDFSQGQVEQRLDAGGYADVANGALEAAQKEAALREQAAQVTAQIQARDQRAQTFGVKGKAGLDVFGQLEAAHQAGTINDAQFAENAGLLAANKLGTVRKFLEGTTATKAAIAASDAAPVSPVAVPAAPGTNAVAPAPQPTATVGRAGRKQEVTKGQLLDKIKAAPPLVKMRILAVTGMDLTEDPTTGAPRLVQAGNPMTFAQVAEEEGKATGKTVTRQAIQQSLAQFGITEDVATQVAATAPTAVTAEDLGVDPNNPDASGYRVEDRASKATGAGLVSDASGLSAAQQRMVDSALNQARKGGFTPAAISQAAKGLGKAAKQRLLELAAKEMDVAAPAAPSSTPTVKAPDGAKVVDLREGNEAQMAANDRALLAHHEAGNAAADWDDTRVNWADLPDTVKASWVDRYIWNLRKNGGDLNIEELENDQRFVEREYHDYQGHKGQQAPTGAVPTGDAGAGGRTAGALEGSGARPVDATQGAGSYVGESGQRAGEAPKPVVKTKAAPAEGLPDTASKEERAAYTRQQSKVQKYEQLLACLTR